MLSVLLIAAAILMPFVKCLDLSEMKVFRASFEVAGAGALFFAFGGFDIMAYDCLSYGERKISSGRIRAGFACGEFPALDVYVRDTFLVRYIASGNVPHEESVLDGKDADGKDVKKDEE